MIGSAFVRKSTKNSDWNAQEHGIEANNHRSHKLFSYSYKSLNIFFLFFSHFVHLI